jgi:EAL domain-containing protein (putative c-di-GMP-specific phosphodiesterase class I)
VSNTFASNPFDGEPDIVFGRNPSDRPPSESRAAFERLIQTSDLSVVFQPIVRAVGGDVYAYEALVRCAVPEYKSPTRLFERAVRERCVGRLGRAIRAVGVPLCAGVPVFFNVHPVELSDRWLVRPDDPIYSHDEPIFLEITEGVPLEHFALCRSMLKEIRSRGDARLVVDDLGAGYSNLKYIADLEPAVVKLDRELVANIDSQPRVQRLVYWLVQLCEDLGAQVVAEGVETEAELSCVRDQGVQLVQGYFLARPGFPLPLHDRVQRDASGRARISFPIPAPRRR